MIVHTRHVLAERASSGSTAASVDGYRRSSPPNLNLAAYHLALDAHPEIGNNALLADALGVELD